MSGKYLLIYICNIHVLSNLLLIYIYKLHWNLLCLTEGADPNIRDALNKTVEDYVVEKFSKNYNK